jgi:tRNA-splicing ligase RtcB
LRVYTDVERDGKIVDFRLPIKSWASIIDDATIDQAINLSNLPVVQSHVALMPDAHVGYGMPIGGVVFTDGALIPNAIGVDIGCGVALIWTQLNANDVDPEKLQLALNKIAEVVPTGFDRRKDSLSEKQAFALMNVDELPLGVKRGWWERALSSLGSLGGGNHFIEFQKAKNGDVYVMLHSGSRGLGKYIGDYYHDLAKRLCERWHSDLPTLDLAFLPLGSSENTEYFSAMDFGMAYAQANREAMLVKVESVIEDVWPGTVTQPILNVHHNFAAWESHRGRNGIVHRKGAIRAREGERLLIPGSMGTASYVGVGMGNPESFNTCQHGAGRIMGRKAAERESASGAWDLKTDMAVANVLMAGAAATSVDEAPRAYKDIEVVMADSEDLVTKYIELRPMGVVKG